MKKILAVLILLPVVSGCLATRNFRDPKERPRESTAYTLTHGEFNIGLGLLGQGAYNLLINGQFAAGIGGKGGKGEVGVNLGHAAFGIVSVYGKYNFIDKKWWALSARVGLTWIYPKLVWAIPSQYRDPLGDINVLSIPVEITASFPVADWVGLHLTAGYRASALFGKIEEETAFLDSDIGSHHVYLRPEITFYLFEKVQLFIGGRLLLWGARWEQIASDITVEDGIFVGVQSAKWRQLDFAQGSFLRFGLDMKFGKYTYMRLWAIFNGSLSESDLLSSSPILPGLEFAWRF